MAFQRAVNREFALVSRIFNPSLRSSRFTDQLITPAFLPSFPALSSSPTNTNRHMHKGNQIDTHTPQFSDLPRLCFPSTSHLSLLFTLLPPSRVLPPFPPPPPSPSIAESTGGNSRYMYGWLLCGCHDNRHEFDMALTYPGGCEPGCRASNGAHVPQEWNSGGFWSRFRRILPFIDTCRMSVCVCVCVWDLWRIAMTDLLLTPLVH